MTLPADPVEIEKARLDGEEAAIEATRAPLMDHLIELRNRLLICSVTICVAFVGCFFIWQQIFHVLVIPYEDALLAVKGPEALVRANFQTTGPLETTITQIRVALFGAICLSFPVLAFQLYRFVAPGLYSHEKGAFTPFLIAAPILFTLGACMAYFVMMPFLMQFALNQEIQGSPGSVGVVYQGRISEYADTVTTLILAFGACFQLPVIQVILGRAGLVSSKTWFDGGRYAVIAIFIIAAVLTPPDIVSQIVLALPMLVLYYMGAGVVRLIEKKEDTPEAVT